MRPSNYFQGACLDNVRVSRDVRTVLTTGLRALFARPDRYNVFHNQRWFFGRDPRGFNTRNLIRLFLLCGARS